MEKERGDGILAGFSEITAKLEFRVVSAGQHVEGDLEGHHCVKEHSMELRSRPTFRGETQNSVGIRHIATA